MSSDSLVIDVGAAVVIAGVVIIAEPGVATGLLLALLLLIICLLSIVIDRLRTRRDGRRAPRRPPTRRAPRPPPTRRDRP